MMAEITWPAPPEKMLVVSCSVCKAYLGIRDVARMQHEHFECSDRCRNGVYLCMVYERTMTGTYAEALRATDPALGAALASPRNEAS
jgi:hypothetical protein